MDNFDKKEAEGRLKTINLLHQYNLTASQDKYSSWDLSGCTTTITEEKRNFYIEVKDREVSSTAYGEETVYLQFDKYQSLMKLSEQNNGDAFYLTHFTDGISYIHNLTKLKVYDLKLTVKNVNKTSVENNGKVDKVFIELPYSTAKRFKTK